MKPTPRNNLRGPRNKFEKKIHDSLKKSKAEFEYERYKLPYTLNKQYTPDFTVVFGLKRQAMHIETKGYFDTAAQTKMKAVKKTNPDIDIRFVFMDASKPIRKGSKTNYGQWADKYGFPWAEGSIPKEWLK